MRADSLPDACMRTARRPFRLFLFALLCIALAGCVDAGFLHPDENGAAPAEAEQWYHNGDYARAGQAFMDLADADRDYRDHYRLRAAEAYREEGNLNAVAWALEGIDSRRLNGDESIRRDLLEAEVALSRHDTARALNLLGFSETTLPPRLRQRALELRARAQLAAGDALNSARTRAALNRGLGGADRSQNEAQIMNTLAQLDP